MAEELARHRFGEAVNVQSAGSRPSGIHPLAIRAMAEVGLDITHRRAKSVDEIDPATVDVVVTLCAEEVCPVFLGRAKRLHWPLPDPAAATGTDDERLAAFRHVRDEIQDHLPDLPPEIGPEGPHGAFRSQEARSESKKEM
jgi:arsenate reductase